MRGRKNRTGCSMSDGYVVVHESDARIRKIVREKSPEQLERERLEAERDRDVAQLLRINEGDACPVWRNR